MKSNSSTPTNYGTVVGDDTGACQRIELEFTNAWQGAKC